MRVAAALVALVVLAVVVVDGDYDGDPRFS